MIIALFLIACGGAENNPQVVDTSSSELNSPLSGEVDGRSTPDGAVQTFAARGLVRTLGGDGDAAFGLIALSSGERLYFFGDPDDVDSALSGEAYDQKFDVVVVSGSTAKAPCVGTLSNLPSALLALAGGQRGTASIVDGQILTSNGDRVVLDACPSLSADWSEVEAAAAAEDLLTEDGADLGEELVPPPATCSANSCASTCGASESSASYAGQTAYSNGKYTTTGCGCTPSSTAGTDSTDDYQCTQFVDRVHGHDGGTYNWTGNASTGYWTSTTAGPYQKGLVPFGTGTSYDAPLAGDVLVWSYSYGHVAIIGSVGTSTLTVYDQNRSCGNQSCTMGYSTSSGYTISNGAGRCFTSTASYTVLGYARRGWDFGATFGLASSSSSTNWWPNDASYLSGSSTSSGSYTTITDYIAVNPGASDPYLTSPAGLAVKAYSSSVTYGYKYLKFYMKSDCSNKTAALYWKRTTDSSFSETRKVTATVSSSWGTVTFNPSTSADWSGTIDQVRIDPAASCSTGSTDLIYLAYAFFDR
jgi:hypothetical protein